MESNDTGRRADKGGMRGDKDRKTTDVALLSDKQTPLAVRGNEKCGIV